MTQADFEGVCRYVVETLRLLEPRRSGNMADRATKIEFPGPFECRIYIDESIAPYAKYTDMPWSQTSPVIVNAPRRPSLLGKSSFLWYRGDAPDGHPKENQNEGWWERAAYMVAELIEDTLRGEVTQIPD